MSDLSPALIEELAKALDDTYEESGGMATSAECIRDLAPILSRALTEAAEEAAEKMRDAAADLMEKLIDGEKVPTDWDDWYESRTIEAIPAAIRAIPNPYLTEKEQS